MIKKKIKQKRSELGQNKILLLNEIFQEIYIKNNEFNLSRFRVQHKDKMRDLDELEWNHVLCKSKDDNQYYLSAFALPAIDPKLTKELFVGLDKIFVCLQSHYEEKQKEPISLQAIIDTARLSDTPELISLIRILVDASVFSQYPDMQSVDADAKFTVDERVINANSFLDFLLRFEHVPEFWSGIFMGLKNTIVQFVTNKYVYPLLLIFVAEIIRFYIEHMN